MVINVGINGFGRIGRVIFRTCCQHPDLEVAAINDPAIELSYICYLIKFDSTHGKYNGNISYEGNLIKINDHSIMVFHQKAPSDIPWQKADVQYVIEASGMFTNMEKASGHLASDGVIRVLVTAPSSDVPMLILGVNQDRIKPDLKVVSCTSSTLYCLAPIIKLLQDAFGVGEGFVTSIHAMTPSLKPLDGLCIRGKHWRDHRSIHQNIIPAATGACKALGRIIPAVRDKLAGLAFRVPIVNVSVLDLCIRLNKNTTIKEITECIEKVKDPALQDIIQVSKEQAVSSDFIGDSHSCTVDIDSSLQLRPNFFKLICWYENEFSYACRVVDTILYSERQHSLISTPLTKMTYVRPIFWKKNSEQTDSKKQAAVDSISITKSSLSPCNSCETRSFTRPIHRPLSPYVSEATNLRKRSVIFDDTNAFRAFIEKFGKSSSEKINLHDNSEIIKQIYHERVKAQERLESAKQEFSRMVETTEDLLRKQSSKKYESLLKNSRPSEEMTEAKNSNSQPFVLKITISAKDITTNENLNNGSLEMDSSPAEEITDKKNINTNSSGMVIKSPSKDTTGKENLNNDSLEIALSPAEEITDKKNINTNSSGMVIKSPSKGTTGKENLNNGSLEMASSPAEEITDKKNINTNSSGMVIKSPSKGTTGKENLNNGSLEVASSPAEEITDKKNINTDSSEMVIKSPSKGTTGKENLNNCSLEMALSPAEEITDKKNINTNSSGMLIKSPSKGTTGKENLNNGSLEMALSPAEEITDKKNINTNSSGMVIKSPSNGTTGKENLNNRLSRSTVRSSLRGVTEEGNLKKPSFRSKTPSFSKETAKKENSNTDLSKRKTKKSSKAITDMENLDDNCSKGVTFKENLKAHSFGLAIKSTSKSFTGKEKIKIHSSEARVKSPSRGMNEKGYPNTYSSGLVTKSPSRGIPMRRPSKVTEKPISNKDSANKDLPSITKKSKDITEDENLHNYLTTDANNSPSTEKTEIEEKSIKDDVGKAFTGNFENNNEISGEMRTTNIASISNSETESLHNTISNENSHKELPKVDSAISNKAENLVGLNALRKIYQNCEKNNIPFNSKNTVVNNNISWDNIQKPNHTKNKTQVSNTVNNLEENVSSTSNVNSSIFDDNDDVDEKHNEEVIHIASKNLGRIITSTNLNVKVENADEYQELLKQCSTYDAETVDLEGVKALTDDLFKRRLSKIEIVDENLKQRNIVLVEHGNKNTKFENNTKEKDDTVPSHEGDYCEDAYQKITGNQEEEGSNSHDSIKIVSEMTSLCVSPVNTVTTISNNEICRSKQDIYDKLDSLSVSGSENSFQMLEKKSQIINITDLTYSLDDLARLDKICRIIEISDELSDKLFAPLDERNEGEPSKHKWSFNDLCKRIKLDEFCNNVFGKSSM